MFRSSTAVSNMLFLAAAIFLSSCASGIKKADIPSTANPTEEIARLEENIKEGHQGHYDILAPRDFAKAKKYLEEAKEDTGDHQDQDEILEDIAYARAYFDRAQTTADGRRKDVSGILQAREGAIIAGAHKLPKQRKELESLDKKMRSNSDNFRKNLSPEQYSDIQGEYLQLELLAIQENQLGEARAIIKGARKDDAEDKAPRVLKRAEVDLKNAENIVAVNRHNPVNYNEAVVRANSSAHLLSEVLDVIRRHGKKTTEDVALQIVRQEHKLSSLEGNLAAAETDLAGINKAMESGSRELAGTRKQLEGAQASVSVQEALENARGKFDPQEADVYQQGNKLLIRLKKMNFASGRAELPGSASPLLVKVTDVIHGLRPMEVTVEGHTDSTGTEAVNQKISQARADAVAAYLRDNLKNEKEEPVRIEAVGYGYSRPITTNKTKEGRAQNRRVDVVITTQSPAMGQATL